MQGIGFSLGLFVLLLLVVLSYKVKRFHIHTLGYLSWLQVLYSVVVPVGMVPMFYVYIKSITEKPMRETVFVTDDVLLMLLLLSAMFLYAGVVIHGVTKMMAAKVDPGNKELYSMIRYFHLSFSHNLVFVGVMVLAVGTAMLEMNHVFNNDWGRYWAILRGIVLGVSLLLGMILYEPYYDVNRKKELDKWMTLRLVFVFSWVLLLVFLLEMRKIRPELDAYQMVIPILVGLVLVNLFSVVLVVKRLKGRWVVVLSRTRLDRLVRKLRRGEW